MYEVMYIVRSSKVISAKTRKAVLKVKQYLITLRYCKTEWRFKILLRQTYAESKRFTTKHGFSHDVETSFALGYILCWI